MAITDSTFPIAAVSDQVRKPASPTETVRSFVESISRSWRLAKWRRRAAREADSFSSVPYEVLKDLYVVRYSATPRAA